jgi:predicted ATP-grasp superfamily ATP-dependent carboligase/beta-phosphoglucomutase-like phosphatase (HAD superfamily)
MTIGLKCSSSILAQHAVLLASAGSRKALAMAQSLKAFGARVLGVTHYTTDPHRFSRFFDRVIVLRGVDRESASWAVHVAEIAAAQGADLVFPVDFMDVVTFSSRAKVFKRLGMKLAAPETGAVLRVSRKDALAELVGDIVRVPRTIPCASTGVVVLDAIKSLQLPLVVKGLGDASKPEYFSSYELAAERAKERAPCLVQEYVAGKGRGYYAITFNGEILIEFTHERVYETDPSGGASIAARGPILDPRLFRLGREIVRRLEWTGPLMVETKWVPATGEYYLLELNPKFWGSLALPVSLGYHFPAALAVAYLKGVDEAKEFCRKLSVRNGEYYFLLDGLFYTFRIPEVWISMFVRSRIVRSDINLKDPVRVTAHLATGMLGGMRSRKEWTSCLILADTRLKSYLRSLREKITGVIFDLDGTLINFRVPWQEVKRKLYSDGILYKWENIREGLFRLWNVDKNLYNKASLIIEEFEYKYLDNVEILANVKALNDIRKEYKLSYHIATFQSKNVANEIIHSINLQVDSIVGRDNGFGPLKEEFYRACLRNAKGKTIVFDDDLTNVISALRVGYLPIWVTEHNYHRFASLRLGIPYLDPRHLHIAISTLAKGANTPRS